MNRKFFRIGGAGILIGFFLFFTACQKEEHLNNVSDLSVSQGTYLGVVHLSWDPVPDAQYYNIDRLDPETGQWLNAATTSGTEVDDYGFNLPDNKLVYGEHYKYRISSASKDADDSEFKEFDQYGWTYIPAPLVPTAEWLNNDHVKVTWSDPIAADVIAGKVKNVWMVNYDIYRKQKGSQDSSKITSTDNISLSPGMDPGTLTNMAYEDPSPGDEPVYAIRAKYEYRFINMDYGTQDAPYYAVTANIPAEGGSGVGPVAYDWFPISDVFSSSGKGVAYVSLKTFSSSVYAGILKEATGDYGTPGIYRFNGVQWELQGDPYPGELMNSTSMNRMNFTRADNKLWLAALDHDSLYVYNYDNNTWSENLTSGNLGAAGSPSSLSMDNNMDDDKPYLAITQAPDYNLKVLKWTGTAWEAVGGDGNGFLTTGKDVFSLELKNIGGSLYLSYLTKNSDYNSTLHILRWSGSSWVTELEWTADNLMEVHINGNGNSLYFISRSQKPGEWPGGVFRVVSQNTVENLIPANSAWFMDPVALTTDTDDHLFIVSTRFVSAQEIYPAIFRYDGSNWNILSGDFSGGTQPAGIISMGTELYYAYGDANNLDIYNHPKTLKAAKFMESVK